VSKVRIHDAIREGVGGVLLVLTSPLFPGRITKDLYLKLIQDLLSSPYVPG
jgi:hypothetical protein